MTVTSQPSEDVNFDFNNESDYIMNDYESVKNDANMDFMDVDDDVMQGANNATAGPPVESHGINHYTIHVNNNDIGSSATTSAAASGSAAAKVTTSSTALSTTATAAAPFFTKKVMIISSIIGATVLTVGGGVTLGVTLSNSDLDNNDSIPSSSKTESGSDKDKIQNSSDSNFLSPNSTINASGKKPCPGPGGGASSPPSPATGGASVTPPSRSSSSSSTTSPRPSSFTPSSNTPRPSPSHYTPPPVTPSHYTPPPVTPSPYVTPTPSPYVDVTPPVVTPPRRTTPTRTTSLSAPSGGANRGPPPRIWWANGSCFFDTFFHLIYNTTSVRKALRLTGYDNLIGTTTSTDDTQVEIDIRNEIRLAEQTQREHLGQLHNGGGADAGFRIENYYSNDLNQFLRDFPNNGSDRINKSFPAAVNPLTESDTRAGFSKWVVDAQDHSKKKMKVLVAIEGNSGKNNMRDSLVFDGELTVPNSVSNGHRSNAVELSLKEIDGDSRRTSMTRSVTTLEFRSRGNTNGQFEIIPRLITGNNFANYQDWTDSLNLRHITPPRFFAQPTYEANRQNFVINLRRTMQELIKQENAGNTNIKLSQRGTSETDINWSKTLISGMILSSNFYLSRNFDIGSTPQAMYEELIKSWAPLNDALPDYDGHIAIHSGDRPLDDDPRTGNFRQKFVSNLYNNNINTISDLKKLLPNDTFKVEKVLHRDFARGLDNRVGRDNSNSLRFKEINIAILYNSVSNGNNINLLPQRFAFKNNECIYRLTSFTFSQESAGAASHAWGYVNRIIDVQTGRRQWYKVDNTVNEVRNADTRLFGDSDTGEAVDHYNSMKIYEKIPERCEIIRV